MVQPRAIDVGSISLNLAYTSATSACSSGAGRSAR